MRHISRIKFRFLFLGVLMSLAMGCDGSTHEKKVAQQSPEDRLEQEKIRRSMLFAIIADTRIETLSEYIVANDMVDLFSKDPGPFIFFTPTNEAFEAFDQAKIKLWSNNRNGIIKSLINKHIVRLDTIVNDLSFYVDQDLQTLGGIPIKVIQDQEQYYLEDVKGHRALINTSPMRMDNGHIYYIDKLLNSGPK